MVLMCVVCLSAIWMISRMQTTNKTYNYETYVYYCSACCYGSGGV